MQRRHYNDDELDAVINESEPFGRAYMQGSRAIERVQAIIEDYNALGVAIEEEFVNDRTQADGDDGYTACIARLIHEVGEAMRRLENALDSDKYRCPECGEPATATVIDAEVGAVYIEPGCTCENVDDQISAAALERWRLGRVLTGEEKP